MPVLCCLSRPAFRPAPRSFLWPHWFISPHCFSARSTECSGSYFLAGIWKPDPMWRRALIAFVVAIFAVPVHAGNRINVVASFSILGDLVSNVGGDRVEVTSLVGRNSDVHIYSPAPSDARKVADAKLVIVNGLGLEGWLSRLLQSSGSKAQIVVATKGITPLKLGSEADPHAWQSVTNAKVYVTNIRDALVAADPSGAEIYRENADRYLAELDRLAAEVRAAVDTIPPGRRKLISTHDAFGYLAAAYGIEFI